MNRYDIITYPLITERSTAETEKGRYSFRVKKEATKHDIKLAIEEAFHVKVKKVNTMRVEGKLRRVRYQPGYAADWKKAIVTLKAGDKIVCPALKSHF